MKKDLPKNTGHVYIEFYLLLALLVVSLAIGFGQYPRYGLNGTILTTVLVFGGVIAFFAAMIWISHFISFLHKKIQSRKWYRRIRQGLHILVLFCFFSLFGAILCLFVIFRFELSSKKHEIGFMMILPIIGILGVILRFYLKETFWPSFGRLCLFLALSVIGGILGMFIGMALPAPFFLYAVDLGVLAPLGIYLSLILKGMIKKKNNHI